MGKLQMPRLLTDILQAMRASTPHIEAANTTQEKIIRLLHEVNDERSSPGPEERAARQQEIDELSKQVRREHDAARHSMDELKARYPRWIK